MTEEAQPAASPPEWPQPCQAAACARPLYAAVAYCPYCGSAQTKAEPAVATSAGAEQAPAVAPAAEKHSSVEALQANIAAKETAAEVGASSALQAPVQPEAKAAPRATEAAAKAGAKATAQPQAAPQPAGEKAAPPPTKPALSFKQRVVRWIRRICYTIGLLFIGIMALGYYVGSSGSARKAEQCTAASQTASTALAAGDIASAGKAAQQAVEVCEDQQLAQARKLLASVERAKSGALRCEQIQAQAEQLLDDGRAARAAALLTRNHNGCQARAYTDLSRKAAAAVNEARQQVDRARSRLRADAYDDADSLLDQALRLDADAAGAEPLRKQIADARAEMQARQQRSQSSTIAAPAAQPTMPAAAPAPAPRAVPSMDALVEGFLQDGERALQQKNYAQAKNAASSALRVDPNHAAARRLLQRAERAEQDALRGMEIE
ncbi:hypothetical protein GPA19_14530 [Azoarcus indigens]|uniref:Tetratricopeptide repeat protein n=1 Tax=Azoarcus indigens TaxID=29545 RepID=A0A4R6DM63_9RHOO|nr:hypothetical protein [Azoarcus indigens]NMG66165.1 hypothetical protein [Azoarcus indigens]TDN45584.1 hypothetical protein C7389_12938 [Azoarcus indigens]